MLKNNLKAKILFSFALILSLVVVLSLFACWQLNNLDKIYGDLFMVRIEKIKDAYEMQVNALNMAYAARGYLIYGTQETYDDFHHYHKEARDILARLPATVKTEKGKQLLAQLDAAEADYYQKAAAVLEAKRNKAGEEEVQAKLSLAAAAVKPLNGAMQEFLSFQLQRLQEDRLDTGAKGRRTVGIITAGCAAILVVSFLLAYFLARMIADPLRLVEAGAARVARGDLAGEEIRVRAKDEVGRLAGSFNAMLANLREIVGQLQEKAQALAASATQLSASAEQVSAGATETASSAGEVASAVEQVSRNAQKIADASRRADAYANEGRAGIQDVHRQMAAIRNSTENVAAAIQGLDAQARQISQIVALITQVAEQTNLLALNAAIEAARAGEYGRGFAVVAEEVRKLAEQSAAAAKEISGLVKAIQEEATKAVAVMDEEVNQVKSGAEVVNSVGETFAQIIALVQELAADIRDIASSAGQMSSAVQNVAGAAQEQTATMEEVSSTAQSLAGLADDLERIAGRFRLA
ncbi:MAG: methyl-accepting chemotaxis protein [Armatimonadetes bacterium]|nr:methyl-accepting chemotaxis protein [Armatimonadota bacterium]